jgi:hypothetical protein
MTKIYTENDIKRLVEKAKSQKKKPGAKAKKVGNFTTEKQIEPVMGDSGEIVVAPGLKLKHLQSGLAYTVRSIKPTHNDIIVSLESGDGNVIGITMSDFKNYERA